MWPSAVALATRFMPSVPPAPTVFSTMIFWPSERPITSPISLAMMSAGPPAENGTTMVMGRDG